MPIVAFTLCDSRLYVCQIDQYTERAAMHYYICIHIYRRTPAIAINCRVSTRLNHRAFIIPRVFPIWLNDCLVFMLTWARALCPTDKTSAFQPPQWLQFDGENRRLVDHRMREWSNVDARDRRQSTWTWRDRARNIVCLRGRSSPLPPSSSRSSSTSSSSNSSASTLAVTPGAAMWASSKSAHFMRDPADTIVCAISPSAWSTRRSPGFSRSASSSRIPT